MKTLIVNGQLFALIEFTNHGSHPAVQSWYPVENLNWLRQFCDVKLIS